MTSQVDTYSVQLGAFRVMFPLRVDVREYPDGEWGAFLEPASQTCNEFGYGSSAEEALADLASTLSEMYDKLMEKPDEALGDALLAYKKLLQQYVVPNTTREVR